MSKRCFDGEIPHTRRPPKSKDHSHRPPHQKNRVSARMTSKTKPGFETLAKASVYTQEQLMKVKKDNHTFFIGLPREISLQENRISLTPDAVGILVNHGHDVWVETKA